MQNLQFLPHPKSYPEFPIGLLHFSSSAPSSQTWSPPRPAPSIRSLSWCHLCQLTPWARFEQVVWVSSATCLKCIGKEKGWAQVQCVSSFSSIHPPLTIWIKRVWSPGVCKKQRNAFWKALPSKPHAEGGLDHQNFTFKAGKETGVAWSLQVSQLLLEAAVTSSSHWGTGQQFDREAVLGAKNFARSFYCQIAR